MPGIPSRTAARVLNKTHPKHFANVEATRQVVARLRGAHGIMDRSLAASSKKEFFTPKTWRSLIPKGRVQSTDPLELPNQSKILLLSDIHAPYHDKEALSTAIEFGIKEKPTDVYLNGDTLDHYSISDYQTNPEERDYPRELETTKAILQSLRKAFPKARLWFKIGNHENRLERYLAKNAPVLLGVNEFRLPSLLKFEDYGVTLVQDRQFTHAGKLTIIHGHELPGKSVNPAMPAKTLYNAFHASAVCGHWHRESTFKESAGYPKTQIACWTTGCLCDMAPDYAPINKWGHGCAIVEVAKDGTFGLDLVSIINGKVF